MKICLLLFVLVCHIVDNEKVFSSGTRLYVTDGNPKVPKVSVYPVSRPQKNGKHVLLCQARDMFPDLVKFMWQAENQNGQKMELKDEMLEQRDEDSEVKITSMLIVDKEKVKDNKFTCTVQHSKEQKVDIPRFQQEDEKNPDPVFDKTCPTPKEKEQEQVVKGEEEEEEKPINDMFELRRSLHLFTLTYVVLLMKNVLYFCAIFALLSRRNAAKQEMLRSKAS